MRNMRETYAQLIAEGKLRADPAQETVMAEFDRIRDALTNPPKKSFFPKARTYPESRCGRLKRWNRS